MPRRIDWRVMMPNQVSIWLIQLEPTGVKWKCTLGCVVQPGGHLGGGVGGQVVQHHMDFLARWGLVAFFRNARNLAPSRLGVHSPTTSPVADVEGGEQVGDAVPLVVVGAFLGLTEVDGQQWLGAIQSLDLGLLIDRQHHRPARRVQIQPDDVGDLVGEKRVLGQLEGADTVRGRLLLAPHPRHVVERHHDAVGALEMRRHLRADQCEIPISRAGTCGSTPGSAPEPAGDLLARPTPPTLNQTRHTLLPVAIQPPVHRRSRHPRQLHNVPTPPALATPQHNPRPRRHHGRHIPTVDQRPQLGDLRLRQHHQTMMDPQHHNHADQWS